MEVGEYVRTKQGYIHKVTSVYKDMIWWCTLDWIPEKDIIKHSKDIFDLIEVGDIISFDDDSVVRVKGIEGIYYLLIDYNDDQFYEKKEIILEDIKSIVTKEMMKSIEYRVE